MAEIRWYGHNCFRIRAREASVLTDPVGRGAGYPPVRQPADVVTLSHEDYAAALDGVKGDYKVLRGPGEYEVSDVFVTGIRTFRDDAKGASAGFNTVYLLEIEGMTFCHLGDLGHALDAEQAEALPDVDVLMIAAGGRPLDQAKAAELVAVIEPKLLVPMQFRTEAGDPDREPLDGFLRQLGATAPDPEDKLTIRSGDLSETMRLAVLRPANQT
jgi:L-ascorbate metabolism protein UlaG (beta-lactamase superfamily)